MGFWWIVGVGIVAWLAWGFAVSRGKRAHDRAIADSIAKRYRGK